MDSLEDLKKRIHTATDLHSLVRTMKALAAVNIRHLEKAVESLVDFKRTIEMGLRIVLRNEGQVSIGKEHTKDHKLGLIVFGTDQGMCGQLNDLVARFAVEQSKQALESGSSKWVAVGARVADRLESMGCDLSAILPVPGSTAGIPPLVQDLLFQLDNWQQIDGIEEVCVVFSEHTSRASYDIKQLKLLPIDKEWLDSIRQENWPTNQMPLFTMTPKLLFSELIKQYLFVSLYRACAESLASENASRLAAMRGAERNIGDRIELLTRDFHQTRQMSITEELLDIASGFEAILSDKNK